MRLAGGLGGVVGRERGSEGCTSPLLGARCEMEWKPEEVMELMELMELMVLYHGIIIIYRKGLYGYLTRPKHPSSSNYQIWTHMNRHGQPNHHALSSHCLVASNSASPCAFALPP